MKKKKPAPLDLSESNSDNLQSSKKIMESEKREGCIVTDSSIQNSNKSKEILLDKNSFGFSDSKQIIHSTSNKNRSSVKKKSNIVFDINEVRQMTKIKYEQKNSLMKDNITNTLLSPMNGSPINYKSSQKRSKTNLKT